MGDGKTAVNETGDFRGTGGGGAIVVRQSLVTFGARRGQAGAVSVPASARALGLFMHGPDGASNMTLALRKGHENGTSDSAG